MIGMTLSAKELICLAAWHGVPEIFGVPDVFARIAPDKLKAEVLQVQQSLQKKGVLSLDFDGNSDIRPEYAELLDVVFHCDHFAALDRQLVEDGHKALLFYRKNAEIIASQLNGQEYSFEKLDTEHFAERLYTSIRWESLNDILPSTKAEITQRSLIKMKKQAGKTTTTELMKNGLNREAASMVADAFALRSNFYSFAFVDVTAKVDGIKSLMFLGDSRGLLHMKNIVIDNADCVSFGTISKADLLEKLDQSVRWFLHDNSGVTA